MVALAFALGALFLGIPHIQESAEAALAPKKQPPQDGPAGQDPGWLESPPHPPSPPPGPVDTREKGCDMQGVYCKNETKADDPDEKATTNLKVHDEGGAMKKLKKKLKATTKIAKVHAKLDNAQGHKKKLKKKQLAHEKKRAAQKRKDAAQRRKGAAQEEDGGEDAEEEDNEGGAVSFLQEAEEGEDAVLKAHDAGGAMKKLKKKLKAKTKIAEAHAHIDEVKDAKKKLKKKQKADEKKDAAKERKHHAESRKEAEQEEDGGEEEDNEEEEDGSTCAGVRSRRCQRPNIWRPVYRGSQVRISSLHCAYGQENRVYSRFTHILCPDHTFSAQTSISVSCSVCCTPRLIITATRNYPL